MHARTHARMPLLTGLHWVLRNCLGAVGALSCTPQCHHGHPNLDLTQPDPPSTLWDKLLLSCWRLWAALWARPSRERGICVTAPAALSLPRLR